MQSIPHAVLSLHLLKHGHFARFSPGPASSGSLERLATLWLASWRASGISEGTNSEEGKLDIREKIQDDKFKQQDTGAKSS